MTDQTSTPRGPIRIDLEPETPETPVNPAEAEPVPDQVENAPMARAVGLMARPVSPLARWFAGFAVAIGASVAALVLWTTLEALFLRNTVLGGAFGILLSGFAVLLVLILLKELSALSRLSSLAKIRSAAARVRESSDLEAARRLATRLSGFYAGRRDLQWSADRLDSDLAECFDADAVLGLAERRLLAPLDAAAQAEVEAAARQVATVTALVPLALADVAAALVVNLRMIRRISEIYGGRSGTFGSWRLTRTVISHLVATGALAIGDDLIGSLAGGGLMSRLSRRFGEGVINGALTARVGIAAIAVTRPLDFDAVPQPSVTSVTTRALAGVFQKNTAKNVRDG